MPPGARSRSTSVESQSIVALRPTRKLLGFDWPSQVTPTERRSLIAGGMGWLLDAFDVMLYSMVLARLMLALGMDKDTAGLLGSLTLVSSAGRTPMTV
jgi:hypothetical protein